MSVLILCSGDIFTDHLADSLTDDPENANFRSPIRMHYIRMIK